MGNAEIKQRKVDVHVQCIPGRKASDRCRPAKILFIPQIFPKHLLGQALY